MRSHTVQVSDILGWWVLQHTLQECGWWYWDKL